jgi:surface polysaccharide O-acyltransferase-like enzyme
LGYYITNYCNQPAQKQKAIGIILYVVAVAFTVIATYHICSEDKIFKETFCNYLSLNVVVASGGIFLWFRQLQVTKPILKRGIRSVARHSYGIYLVHFIFIDFAMKFWQSHPNHPLLYVPCLVLFTFLASWASIYLISKLPYSKYFVG